MSNIQSETPYVVEDKKSSIDSVPAPLDLLNDQARALARPPIDYSSFDAFCHSTWRRFLSIWTRRFILSLLAGQVVSLCITCTNVTTEELTTGNWQLPTTQTFFLYQAFFFSLLHELSSSPSRYFSIFIIYTPYTIYQCMLFLFRYGGFLTLCLKMVSRAGSS